MCVCMCVCVAVAPQIIPNSNGIYSLLCHMLSSFFLSFLFSLSLHQHFKMGSIPGVESEQNNRKRAVCCRRPVWLKGQAVCTDNSGKTSPEMPHYKPKQTFYNSLKSSGGFVNFYTLSESISFLQNSFNQSINQSN